MKTIGNTYGDGRGKAVPSPAAPAPSLYNKEGWIMQNKAGAK